MDIEKLKLLNDALHLGHHIGGVANLSLSELKNLLSKESENSIEIKEVVPPLNVEKIVDDIITESIEAIKAYDGRSLETLLLKASTKMNQPQLIENLIIPLVYKVGDLWHDGFIRVANEHLASAVIRSFLSVFVQGQV